MSTANTVTVSCLLDDGTGTYPIDVSSQVSLSAGIDLSGYGRADESTSASAAQLTFTLKNNDGSFTTGVPGGFGGSGFGGGFFGGVVTLVKGRLLKFGLTVGGAPRTYFTGRIDSFSQSFTGAPGKRSDITITALDAMSDFGKRPLRSMIEQEILLDSPTAYYTLGEAEGSTSAGDTSGNAAVPLSIAGSGTALTFGTGIGPTDSLPCVQFNGGTYLSGSGQTWITASGPYTVECFFATTVSPSPFDAAFVYADDGTGASNSAVYLSINTAGNISVTSGFNSIGAFPAVDVNDGLVHHIAATLGPGPTWPLTLYVDGVAVNTTSGGAARPPAPVVNLSVAPLLVQPPAGFPQPVTGSVAHVAVYPTALSAGRVAAHAAARTAFAETSSARLTRLASYAGTTAITTTGSGQLMGAQSTSGQSLLDAMGVVADAEGGVVYIDGLGQLRMQGRYYRALKVTASLSLSGKAVDPGAFAVVDDTAQAINFMTVTRINGATQTWPLLAPSTNLYPGSLDLAVDTDASALTRAQWTVAKHASPGPRLPSAETTDLRTSSSATSLHARDLGDRIHLTALPATTNPGLGDVTIEGWSMHLDRDTWTFTYNLLPWSLATAFILDDTTYGVLDSTTPIGY